MSFFLIVSLLTGHNVTCETHHYKYDSSPDHLAWSFTTDQKGGMDMATPKETCQPGFNVTGTSFSSPYSEPSLKVCEALGKNFVKQHEGVVGIKATYSCTQAQD